jgi:hypothetical protein
MQCPRDVIEGPQLIPQLRHRLSQQCARTRRLKPYAKHSSGTTRRQKDRARQLSADHHSSLPLDRLPLRMRERLARVDDDLHPPIRNHALHRQLSRTGLEVPEALDKAGQRWIWLELLVLQTSPRERAQAEQDSSEMGISRVV